MPEDIVNFLKEKRGGILIKSLNWWGPLRLRTLAFVAMQKGFFSFSEFCQLLLPSFFLPTRSKLMDRYYKFLCEESKREYPGTLDGCVNLFGHKFGGPDYREVIELTNEVVVLNQYHPDQFLLKDSIIIDAGANIGMFSALAAHIALYGHVYAFEPVEKTFQALKKNMEYYPQVICEKAGLGNKNLKKKYYCRFQRYRRKCF